MLGALPIAKGKERPNPESGTGLSPLSCCIDNQNRKAMIDVIIAITSDRNFPCRRLTINAPISKPKIMLEHRDLII